MKNAYASPSLTIYGTVSGITAAIGGDPQPDDSNFSQIPAGTGSQDICIGDDVTSGVDCQAAE